MARALHTWPIGFAAHRRSAHPRGRSVCAASRSSTMTASTPIRRCLFDESWPGYGPTSSSKWGQRTSGAVGMSIPRIGQGELRLSIPLQRSFDRPRRRKPALRQLKGLSPTFKSMALHISTACGCPLREFCSKMHLQSGGSRATVAQRTILAYATVHSSR
jgi:hypothetical protein